MVRKLVTSVVILVLLLVASGDAAQAATRSYTVGQDYVVVKWGHLPKAYHAPLKEAVTLINKYTTSEVRFRKWCGSAKFCVPVYERTSYGSHSKGTYGGAMATFWKWTYVTRADGSSWAGWMGNYIAVHRDYRNVGRWRLRGAFAHELGHVFTLQHDYKMSNGMWNKPPSIMGNNGQGSKRYFSVASKNYWGYYWGGQWYPYDNDWQILKRF